MASAVVNSRFAPEAYLAWEEAQTERHQYEDGEVFGMAGAQDTHVTVTGNAYMALRQHLAGTPCRTFMIDMRLHVQAANAYFYPDVMVTCSAHDTDTRSVDIFRKGQGAGALGLWVLHPFSAGQTVHWASVGLDISAAVLFADLDEWPANLSAGQAQARA